MTLEIAKHTSGRPPFPDGRGASGYVSAFKLPRIQIPRFEDNVSGSVNWENFRSMMTKLPSEIDPQEKAFILKRALTGESAKLVANEQSYEQAINMLASVYWNELLQLQSKIQELITLLQQEASEKNHTTTNRSLWQQIKLLLNFLGQQIQNQETLVVLDSLLCALVVQKLSYQMRQIFIRARRETEENTAETLSFEDLLDLYSNLIHDLKLIQGSQKEKTQPKKVEHGGDEPDKPKRRTLLTTKSKVTGKKK